MIKVTVLGNELVTDFAQVTDTVGSFLADHGIETGRSIISIHGVPVRDLSTTFEQNGVEDESEVRVSSVVKAESAAVKVRFLCSTPKTDICSVNDVLEDVLNRNEIPVERSIISLFGVPVRPGDMVKSLAALGVEDETEVRISSVVKAESAR